jgi:hypothetical protein
MSKPQSSFSPIAAVSAQLKIAREAVAGAARLVREHEPKRIGPIPTKSDWLDQMAELLDELTSTDCSACGEPIDGEDHTPHDRGCAGEGCQCDNRTHPGCCWDCTSTTETAFLTWARQHLGGHPTAQALLAFAQQWEEIADSHGADPVRYAEADVIWNAARKQIEQEEGLAAAKQAMEAYGWRTRADLASDGGRQ